MKFSDLSRDVQITWAAGLLEGEGCFGWYGQGNRFGWNLKGYPCVTVCSTDRDVIERIGSTFSGTVRETKPTVGGKRVWEFRTINTPAMDIMVEIFPLMSERRQAKIKEISAMYAERSVALIHDFMGKQYCPHGHRGEFGYRKDNGNRYCRACQREYMQRKRAEGVNA